MWMEGPLGNNAVGSLSHSHRKKETSDVKRLTFNRKCGEDDKAPGSGLTTCPGRHTAAYRLPLTWACVIRVEFPGIGNIFSCPPAGTQFAPDYVRVPHQAASAAAAPQSLEGHLCPGPCKCSGPVVRTPIEIHG